MFIIVVENKEYISKIEFIFINEKIKIITKKELLEDNNYNNYLFFTKFLYPKIDFINEIKKIINEDILFCYLSKCKNIFYVNKKGLKITNNSIDIKNNNIYKILFDSSNYNNITNIIPPDDVNSEYVNLLNYNLISYDMTINNNIAYKAYEKFLKYNVKNNFCYNIILFINNIKDLNNINLSKTYNFYRITIFHTFKFHDDFNLLKIFCKKNNILNCFYIANNFIYFYDIILKRLLWFEKILFIENINLVDFNLLNNYHQYKKNILLKGIISINATDYCLIPFFSFNKNSNLTKNEILKIIENFLIQNKFNNTFIKLDYEFKLEKQKFLNNNNNLFINKLLMIRDYNTIIDKLNQQLKENYDKEKMFHLIIKKFSISTLCKPEEELIKDLNLITESINSIEYLNNFLILLSGIKNDKLIKRLYIKIIKLTDQNKLSQLTIKCFLKLLTTNINEEEIIVILDFINYIIDSNSTLINLKEVSVVLFLNITKFLEKENIIKKFNIVINKIYNIDNISDIDKLLKINDDTNKNNIMILHYLIFIATNFSPYYKTYDEFLIKRDKIESNIKYLLTKNFPSCSFENIGIFPVNNFFLSYQGIPSVEIFKLKSNLVRKICPDLNYKIDCNFKNTKINVCFHSNFLSRKHSVYKDRHCVIKAMADNNNFNVYFSTFDNLNEDVKYTFGKAKHIKLSSDLSKIKKTLEDLKLDVLVYCEIGMDPKAYFMAHMKLAKIQINTWGHSDSSGIDSIDYFISSKLYELPYKEAQTHYSEKLILLNSLCTYYINPLSFYNINTFKNRYEFGFTDEITILFCIQSLFKFNPLFDEYLIDILQSNKNFVLIISNNENKADVIKRFNNKKITSQIHVFPSMQHSLYLNVMNISDIVLDPYPFGGCNSSLEAFSLNKVVVTHESKMINGRFTSGFYKKMKLENLIAKNKKEYVNLTLKLANNSNYKNKIENLIKERKVILYEDKETIDDWINTIKNIV